MEQYFQYVRTLEISHSFVYTDIKNAQGLKFALLAILLFTISIYTVSIILYNLR